MNTATTVAPALAAEGTFISDKFVVAWRDTFLLFARLFMAYLFLESGIGHSGDLQQFANTFKNFQLPASLGVPAALLAVIVEVAAAVALIAGYRVRETCVLLILFLLVTIFVGHRFWEFEGQMRRWHVINVKKNVALIGGVIALMMAGAGRFSLSAWLARK